CRGEEVEVFDGALAGQGESEVEGVEHLGHAARSRAVRRAASAASCPASSTRAVASRCVGEALDCPSPMDFEQRHRKTVRLSLAA
ncbi:hypothetical protein ACFWIB_42865, partial [Streptomyces sp. NPDC127051]|uniref:hypothetical protein n=1 Tax=Streptomyces sp. NPDC127051 TaxID=3347119 RepID=UPI00365E8E7A